jgi:hypothetical protein
MMALATTPSETKQSDACMVSVRDQRSARKSLASAQAHLSGDLVADETDHASDDEYAQVGKGAQGRGS